MILNYLGLLNYTNLRPQWGMMDQWGMMGGAYGYSWMIFSWVLGLLSIVALVLLILWLIKKIQNEDKMTDKNERRLKNEKRDF